MNKVQNLIILALTAAISMTAAGIAAQNNTNSPYTRYGYGQLQDQGFSVSQSMGGISYGLRSNATINPGNPASYSAIDSTRELVKEVRIHIPAENEKASFIRLELRKSLSLPMLNAAARARVENGVIKEIMINMAPVGVGPKRARAAEEFLLGKELNEENAAEAGKLALKDANPRSNPLRGSKEYREETLPVIIERAVADIGVQLGLL